LIFFFAFQIFVPRAFLKLMHSTVNFELREVAQTARTRLGEIRDRGKGEITCNWKKNVTT
jgi:hypothetical protein